MDTGQGPTNAAYFRWVYTLFFVTQNKLFLLKFPSITPFFKTTWNDSKSQLNSVVFKDLIAFDPDSAAGNKNISTFPIQEKSLKNLYLYLVEILKFHRIQVIITSIIVIRKSTSLDRKMVKLPVLFACITMENFR